MAIAVSGGGDSIALLHRAARWADDRGRDLIILTVDHGLRAEAVDEAAFVETTAQSLGLKALTLKWQ
ncbi:MAG: ATP-binding protein, partial [Pseudomonadota bacterium]